MTHLTIGRTFVWASMALCACAPRIDPLPETNVAVSSTPEPASPDATAKTSAPENKAIEAALTHPDRLASDHEIDARRHPKEVLSFIGIAPGMTVLDMFSGSGYYAEIVHRTVSPGGKVWAHNNTPYLKWLEEPIQTRFANERLAGIHRFTAENNELELPVDQFDAVLMMLTYHDIYHIAPQYGWQQIDGPKMMQTIFQSMKPGAVLGIVDHRAKKGAPSSSGEDLHRIDPALARREIEQAGFIFEAESDVLANEKDTLELNVMDPNIRGNTSRFVFRFRKPSTE